MSFRLVKASLINPWLTLSSNSEGKFSSKILTPATLFMTGLTALAKAEIKLILIGKEDMNCVC